MAIVKVLFRRSAEGVIRYVFNHTQPGDPADSEYCPSHADGAVEDFKMTQNLHQFQNGRHEVVHIVQSWSEEESGKLTPPEAKAVITSLSRKYEYVFSYRDGSRPHEDSFLKPLRKAAKRAQITKRIDLHTFRHSYGTWKIRMGWGLKKVFKLLGHSDISVTADIYTHLMDGDLKVRDSFLLHPSPPSQTLEALLPQLSALITQAQTFQTTQSLHCLEQEIERLKKQIQTNMERSGAKAPDFRFLLKTENSATQWC